MSTQPALSSPSEPTNGYRPEPSREPDLVDRIAAALPVEIRADYYREMRHCRLLPENDEMLRILKIMQFLTLMMEQVPSQVAAERERLGAMLAASFEAAREMQQTNLAYYCGLEARIAQLPKAIEQGISPEAIAARINEAIRQQFAQTGLPETAKALGLLANQVKQSTREFQQTASELTSTYNGVAAQARREMDSTMRVITSVASYAQGAQEKLTQTFLDIRPRLIAAAAAVVLAAGMLLGWVLHPSSSAIAEACTAPMVAPGSVIPPEQPVASEKPALGAVRKRQPQPIRPSR